MHAGLRGNCSIRLLYRDHGDMHIPGVKAFLDCVYGCAIKLQRQAPAARTDQIDAIVLRSLCFDRPAPHAPSHPRPKFPCLLDGVYRPHPSRPRRKYHFLLDGVHRTRADGEQDPEQGPHGHPCRPQRRRGESGCPEHPDEQPGQDEAGPVSTGQQVLGDPEEDAEPAAQEEAKRSRLPLDRGHRRTHHRSVHRRDYGARETHRGHEGVRMDEACRDHDDRHGPPTGLAAVLPRHGEGSAQQTRYRVHEEPPGRGHGSVRDAVADGAGETQHQLEAGREELADVRRQAADVGHERGDHVEERVDGGVGGAEVQVVPQGVQREEGQVGHGHFQETVQETASHAGQRRARTRAEGELTGSARRKRTPGRPA